MTQSFFGRGAAAAVIAAGLAFAGPAVADGHNMAFGGEISGTITFTNDYLFRGISQTDESAAVQASIDYGHPSGLYFGVWGSNIDFEAPDDADVEVDFYGGYASSFRDLFDYDLGFIYYYYPGAEGSLDYDYVEVAGSVSRDFDLFTATLGANYSPDNFGGSGDAGYISGAVDIPTGLPFGTTINLLGARQEIDENATFGAPDYWHWSIGASAVVEGFDVTLSWNDTDIGGCEEACEAVLVTVGRTF